MSDYQNRKLELARTTLRRLENRRQLRAIARQIELEAERITIEDRPKKRRWRRGISTWTGADERYFQAVKARLEEQHANDIGRIARKIERQTRAIEDMRRRLGINEPEEREHL